MTVEQMDRILAQPDNRNLSPGDPLPFKEARVGDFVTAVFKRGTPPEPWLEGYMLTKLTNYSWYWRFTAKNWWSGNGNYANSDITQGLTFTIHGP